MTPNKTKKLVLGALLAAFTCVATMLIKVPTPTFGYIHLGDGLVLLCGMLLGPAGGAAAAGIGSMLADLFSGYVAWMPGTLVIKALTAAIGGLIFRQMQRSSHSALPAVLAAGIPAELCMVVGYFLYEILLAVLSGSAVGAAAAGSAAGIPFNLVQGAVGVIIAAVLIPIFSHLTLTAEKRGV